MARTSLGTTGLEHIKTSFLSEKLLDRQKHCDIYGLLFVL